MNESIQKWLERNRPPRVKITYDVETAGAIEKRELPFVVGLFADLSGNRDDGFADYAQRTMQAIDRDSFNDVMAHASPSVLLGQVRRTLPTDDPAETMLSGTITFKSLTDFEPVAVVQAVAPLAQLYRLRGNIRMLQTKAESSSGLGKALEPLMQLDATGKDARTPLQVLADPTARTNLPAAQQALRAFALQIAQAQTTAAKIAAATAFGFAPPAQTGTTADLARKFLGLFSATATPENQRATKDQLTALASFSQPAESVDTQTKNTRALVAKNLGLAGDGSQNAAIASEASSLLKLLNVPPADGATEDQVAAYFDVERAALIYLGLQEPEDSASVQSPDPVTGARLSDAQVAEQKHVADSRWFANNMLIAAQGGTPAPTPPPTPTVTPKPKPTTAPSPTVAPSPDTTPSPAPTSAPAPVPSVGQPQLVKIQAVLALLDTAGLKTDDDRQSFLAPLGYFVTDILSQLDGPGAAARKPVTAVLAIDQRVVDIDKQLSMQLREIMHAPGFQALEATWRGMFYLVSRAETGKMLKLYVFNATQQELLDDMDRAVDKDQSHLFKMIYEAGYGTLGGQPYSLLVGGYEVGHSAQDIEFLGKIAEVAAAAHAPFITAASPSIFGLDRFGDLARPRDLEKIFEGVELVGFQSFRQTEDSRYVTLVLPHVLLRQPYGAKSLPVQGLAFEENPDAADPSDFLWGNASYLLAERITNAFSLYAWTAAIRGVEGGGLIEGLPLYTYPIYPTNSDAQQLFCPTEVSITDRREKELSDLGFIALCHCMGTGTAAFFGGQTANQPKVYISNDANANAKLSALLPYMLSASRFAHYIKVIMRDKIGSFLTRSNVEAFLNTWISQYVLLDENAPQDAKASYPLSQANVIVTDVPGEPGSYNAVVFLRPHFQLEELTTSIRLVANLPAAS
jgi:type VI secretion system protein ImpC